MANKQLGPCNFDQHGWAISTMYTARTVTQAAICKSRNSKNPKLYITISKTDLILHHMTAKQIDIGLCELYLPVVCESLNQQPSLAVRQLSQLFILLLRINLSYPLSVLVVMSYQDLNPKIRSLSVESRKGLHQQRTNQSKPIQIRAHFCEPWSEA